MISQDFLSETCIPWNQDIAFLAIKRDLQNLTASEVGDMVAHSNLLILDMVLDLLANDLLEEGKKENHKEIDTDYNRGLDQAIDCEIEDLLESCREER